ncbi:hypothetical protein V5O48_014704, partial [Marasmius crinis-equi]
MVFRDSLLYALAAGSVVFAHHEPRTGKEFEAQRALRATAYHCAPAVAEFTAARQRLWAQKVLSGGNPQLPGYDLFPETYGDHDQEQIADKEFWNSSISSTIAPVVTEGPYYHIAGHPIRRNVAEYQLGLLTVRVEFYNYWYPFPLIDVETCKPLPNVLVDLWHANATGQYAGHPETVPQFKNVGEKIQIGGKTITMPPVYPRTKEEETWLRGAWPTDRNGVAQFTSPCNFVFLPPTNDSNLPRTAIFPGYYSTRATHIHAKVFTSWTPLPNGTFEAGNLAHTGQFFFDDGVNTQVDKMHPYTDNPIRHTEGRTRNSDDLGDLFQDSHENGYNPVFDAHLLGGILNQGLVAYITIGINASASYDNSGWEGF